MVWGVWLLNKRVRAPWGQVKGGCLFPASIKVAWTRVATTLIVTERNGWMCMSELRCNYPYGFQDTCSPALLSRVSHGR